MPSETRKSSLRAVQVLLGDRDRALQSAILTRLTENGDVAPGPTRLYRAGLVALSRMDLGDLRATLADADSKPSLEAIRDAFLDWCSRVETIILEADRGLIDTNKPRAAGYFYHAGRLVTVSPMQDGRIVVSGFDMASGAGNPPGAGADTLFPNAVARLVSMDTDGLFLVAETAIAYLRRDDDKLDPIRQRFANHRAKAIR